jgi:hypothetical protein
MIGGCSAEPIRVDRDRIDDCKRPTVRTKLPLAQAGLSIDVFGLFSAAHIPAGHDALCGSGPDRKPAFDNASEQLGCPDRRIDRLCITCCSSSRPSHHAGCPARSRLYRKRHWLLVVLALSHHCPGHPGDLIGEPDFMRENHPPSGPPRGRVSMTADAGFVCASRRPQRAGDPNCRLATRSRS